MTFRLKRIRNYWKQALRAGSSFIIGVVALWPLPSPASDLADQEAAIVRSVDQGNKSSIRLLEELVNIDSFTLNIAGVREVANVLQGEFERLGFLTKLMSLDAVQRGPALIAEHEGSLGNRVMLIGHMDTVEASSSFRRFLLRDGAATGSGVADMKGGLIVILSALEALRAAGVLEAARIDVFLLSDGASLGEPLAPSRRSFIEMGKHAQAVLAFEPAVRIEGQDYVTIARRGQTFWELRVLAKSGRSGGIPNVRWILDRFRDRLTESNMSFSAETLSDSIAKGDLRVLGIEQLLRVEEEMQSIVGRLPKRTRAEIRFSDRYPPMGPAPGNAVLLERYNEAGRMLGAHAALARDPMAVGSSDASFVAPYADTLDGIGVFGTDLQTSRESVDVTRLAQQSKRAALLIASLVE